MSLESNPNDRRLDMKKRFTEEQIIGFLRERGDVGAYQISQAKPELASKTARVKAGFFVLSA